MKKSKLIALCSVTTGFATIFMIIGGLIETLDLSCIFFASMCMMIPLSKNSKMGAMLSYLATLILSLLLTQGRFYISVAFGLFFGLHPIVNYIFNQKNINKILAFLIKLVWFMVSCFIIYYTTKMFVVENAIIEKYINIIIPVFSVCFLAFYDFCMQRFQRYVDIIIQRLKL